MARCQRCGGIGMAFKHRKPPLRLTLRVKMTHFIFNEEELTPVTVSLVITPPEFSRARALQHPVHTLHPNRVPPTSIHPPTPPRCLLCGGQATWPDHNSRQSDQESPAPAGAAAGAVAGRAAAAAAAQPTASRAGATAASRSTSQSHPQEHPPLSQHSPPHNLLLDEPSFLMPSPPPGTTPATSPTGSKSP